MHCVGVADVDAFPSAVLSAHYPTVQNYGDLNGFKDWNVGPYDLLVGGTRSRRAALQGFGELNGCACDALDRPALGRYGFVSVKPADYLAAGFALVPIPRGTKGPNRKGWNKRENCVLPSTWDANIGLAHAYSGTCALDLDRLDDASKYLQGHGIDVNVLLNAPDAVQISSGRSNRAKLLYRLAEPLPSKKLASGALELRCASADGLTVQDVLPPSIHPDTGKPYEWIGDWRVIPIIPTKLLELWQSLCVKRESSAVVGTGPAMSELRDLVAKHSPNAPYDADEGDSFLKIGMAIHDATNGSDEGFALWDEFLQPGVKYEEGRPNLPAHWHSFQKGKGITWNWLHKGVALDAEDFSPLAEVDDIEMDDEPQPVRVAVSDQSWPVMRRKKNGRIEPAYLNIYNAVNCADFCGMHIGYDKFRAELMQAPTGSDRSALRPFGDNHYGQLRRALEARGFDSTSVDNVRQAVAEVGAANTFDSAQDWLAALEHDGKQRCATFLRDYFGAADTEYTRAVSLYLWTALAARVNDPGCQADMAIIMVSRQGERKSTGISSLVPRPEQFVELNLDEDDDNLARMMAGCLIGELAELRGLATRDLEGIKSFITRKHEKWVPKYKEFANTYPRRLIFIGTTNKREFLADETGERRFLPVDVIKANPEAIARDRDQLWAEGRDLYGLLGIAWQRAEELGRQAVKSYKVSDSWEEPISLWLAAGDGLGGSGAGRSARNFTITEVATGALAIDAKHVNKGVEMRIAKVLSGFSFERKLIWEGGVQKRVWATNNAFVTTSLPPPF